MFNVSTDPVTEKGVRVGNTWTFVSFDGTFHQVNITANGLAAGAQWAGVTPAERKENWRPGGLQQLAAHAGLNRLYSIMHQGPVDTHKDPGMEVWVYDLARKVRTQRITMKNPAGSIQVTRDAKPLLFAAFIGSTTTDVYDALSGDHLRSIENLGTTPTVLVTP
jgi:methylamine dehydrogenase heavy chain